MMLDVSGTLDELVDPGDREYAASVGDEDRRAVIVASMLRYRAPERLAAGDAVPAVTVTRLDPPGAVRLDELARERAVVLVFGSYT